jgi:hypothetical protein
MFPKKSTYKRRDFLSDILVFITATINAGKTPHVERRAPKQREQDYLDAFRAWMSSNCNADVLFCENSNADLSIFREVATIRGGKDATKVLSFSGNAGAQKKGKGYGEIEMLRYAFDAIPELKDYRYIVKVSGRYRVKNGAELIDRVRHMSADLICDIHANLTYGDTNTVVFKPKIALEHLMPYQEELDENQGVIIEHLMAKCLHRTLLASGSWAPLPCTPYCDGISGSWNIPQHCTLFYRIKQNIKRKIAAWIYRY